MENMNALRKRWRGRQKFKYLYFRRTLRLSLPVASTSTLVKLCIIKKFLYFFLSPKFGTLDELAIVLCVQSACSAVCSVRLATQ